MHDVEFSDDQIKDHAANTIAENKLIRVDSEYSSHLLKDSIADWKKGETSIDMIDTHYATSYGKRRLRKTTLV